MISYIMASHWSRDHVFIIKQRNVQKCNCLNCLISNTTVMFVIISQLPRGEHIGPGRTTPAAHARQTQLPWWGATYSPLSLGPALPGSSLKWEENRLNIAALYLSISIHRNLFPHRVRLARLLSSMFTTFFLSQFKKRFFLEKNFHQ